MMNVKRKISLYIINVGIALGGGTEAICFSDRQTGRISLSFLDGINVVLRGVCRLRFFRGCAAPFYVALKTVLQTV